MLMNAAADYRESLRRTTRAFSSMAADRCRRRALACSGHPYRNDGPALLLRTEAPRFRRDSSPARCLTPVRFRMRICAPRRRPQSDKFKSIAFDGYLTRESKSYFANIVLTVPSAFSLARGALMLFNSSGCPLRKPKAALIFSRGV